MKRLLQISLDTLLISILPILIWLILGFVISKDISDVFSLTYPLQFIYMLFTHIFAVGPNITEAKLKKDNVVYSNMLFGTLIIGVFTFLLAINANKYINIMNMNPDIYKNFCIYSMIWFYFSFVMQLITQRLYYNKKNNESNKINLIFNLTNFFSIILLSLFTKNEILSIVITLSLDSLILLYEFLNHFKLKKFELNFVSNIKYTSFSILSYISMFLVYGVGFSNSFSYGAQYMKAINFEGLTTDAQWDVLSSIDTSTKIDVSKNNFNYKEHLKNSYKLTLIVILTILLMNISLYWYFKPNIKILIILLLVQIIDILLNPIIAIKLNYIQINSNDKKNNFIYFISRILRIISSFIPSAFCTYIGQICSMIYQYIFTYFKCKNNINFKLKQ